MKNEIEIPDGHEARIVGNKVVFVPKESDDEIHRKWILEYLYDGLHEADEQFKDDFKAAIDWLEKQKEQKPISSCDIVPYIDDKIAALQDMWREEKVSFDWDDMKDMIEDVARHFYHKEQKPAEWSEDIRNWKNIAYYVLKEWLGIGQYLDNPALDKIAEELQKRYGPVNPVSIPQWSEEDEKMLRLCENRIMGTSTFVPTRAGLYDMVSWLKSLRPQPKIEWSEEDERNIDGILDVIRGYALETGQIDEKSGETKEPLASYIRFVRSLRPQPHWKPSDEQIRPLEYAIDFFKKKKNDTTYLESLLNDLKNL